jgi:hypothetical protein
LLTAELTAYFVVDEDIIKEVGFKGVNCIQLVQDGISESG